MSEASKHYVITVLFELHSGTEARFLDLVNENASASVRDEPGCLLFDVLVPSDHPAQPAVLLYEVYTSRSAFEEHTASRHYRDFDAATRAFVTRKEVREYTLFEHRTASAK
jgi:(4S)-4-hydroxy-5-phosphonooxypentane-2,3-dione isomerase